MKRVYKKKVYQKFKCVIVRIETVEVIATSKYTAKKLALKQGGDTGTVKVTVMEAK